MDKAHRAAGSLRFAAQRLRRGWSSGDLRVLFLALVVAAAAAVAVGQFTDRVRRAIENNSGEAFGADAVIRTPEALSPDLVERMRQAGLRTASSVNFPSVVAFADKTQLATLVAVSPGYPLRGAIMLAGDLSEPPVAARDIPPRGEAWGDPGLWTALGVKAGDRLQVGYTQLKLTQAISSEPGRGGAFAELAPELIINAHDLGAANLLGPGSRVQYNLQLAGTPDALDAARKMSLPPEARFIGVKDSNPEIRESLNKARGFLNIANLATLMLAAAAVALSARQHGARLRDEIALLKCLGARRIFLIQTLTWQALLIGLMASAAGAVLGVLLQEVLAQLAVPAMGISLPEAHWQPVLMALVLVILLLFGFALPPMLSAVGTAPIQVFQRVAQRGTGRVATPLAILALGLLLWLQTGEWRLAGYVIAGMAITALALGFCAWLLVRLIGRTRSSAGVAWRFGMGNLARRQWATVWQCVALGIALLSLLLVTVVREDLLDAWRNRLPADAPNEFLINIQPAQVEPLRAFFAAHQMADTRLWPMARARLTAINGVAVTADSFADPETRRWINREFNLSWTDRFGDDNTLLAGKWWDESAHGRPLLSATDDAFERLKLKLGDILTFDLAGQSFALTLSNERKVNWDSFRPNFFLVAPSGVLDKAGATQWITSFYLPESKRGLLRELVAKFPNVTPLDLTATLSQVRSIIDRIVRAIEFMLMFTLVAGLVVMLAVIEGSRPERVREAAVLRALGASRRVVLQGLIAEYAALGVLAGTVAAVAAQTLAWVLAVKVFEIDYGPRPLIWIAGAAGGGLLVTVLGSLSLRGVLNTPPRQVLVSE